MFDGSLCAPHVFTAYALKRYGTSFAIEVFRTTTDVAGGVITTLYFVHALDSFVVILYSTK